jgi:predicted transcriptional regulator
MPKGDEGPADVLTTLRMDPNVYRRIRHLAIEQGTTVKAVVTRALTELLAREERRATRRKVR